MNLVIPKKVALAPLFFFLVLVCLPIVDNLTGALFKLKLMSEGAIGSPSQLVRFILFTAVVWLVNNEKNNKSLPKILLVTCYLFAVELVLACFHMNFKAFLSGIVFSIKILFALCCYSYVASWINFDKQRTIYVIKQIINYGTIVAVLVLLAYLSGFHISNYKIGIATRGLFISGNGLGIVLGISTIFLVHFSRNISLLWLSHIFLLMATTALLGTKASLVFLMVALALLSLKLAKQAPIITVILLTFFSIYFLLPLIDILSALFENIIYKFSNIDDKLTLIASSRDLFIKNAFAEMKVEALYALRVLFGGGAYYAYTDFTVGNTILRKSLENDLFELFFSYGIVSIIAYLSIYIYAIKSCFSKHNFVIALSVTLVFLHSILMGHVLFNGTSAITYALCLAVAANGEKVKADDF